MCELKKRTEKLYKDDGDDEINISKKTNNKIIRFICKTYESNIKQINKITYI